MKVEKFLENVSMKIVDNTLDKPKMLLSLIYCKISASEIQKSLEPKMNLVNNNFNKPFHLELPQWVSTLRPRKCPRLGFLLAASKNSFLQCSH